MPRNEAKAGTSTGLSRQFAHFLGPQALKGKHPPPARTDFPFNSPLPLR
ncbi:hypothetical protein EIO_2172 [Ketogulonicigenium vulgare Y25]|nr:hypothetical protein EIO_2172 [Ketogulonicigenium vulgare Y25]AOZ55311.1 hypothetical protein KVC_2306 [Ketogulonicigenium vulgare]